jgi:hypothetical protein
MTGNDQIAFYSTVPGYYPTPSYQSPISLVAYRINQDTSPGNPAYLKLQRMGKGFIWNGVAPAYKPILFFDNTNATTISFNWPNAASSSAIDSNYEIIAPHVFRFEYYYLLKGLSDTQPAIFSDTPWDTRIPPGHLSVSGMQDVAAIVVAIAVIDPKGKVLLNDDQIAAVAGTLPDFTTASVPGGLIAQWEAALDANTTLPRPAVSGIRLYERYFYLSR